MITVRALGASEIRIGRKRIPLGAEMGFALGLYLCTRAGERLTRDELCEVFWGDARDALGRHSLRQMLYRLRRHGLTLDEDGEELYLDPARVDSDLSEALKESWVATAEPAAIETATSLAPGFTRHISERFQEWFDGIRHRLAAQHRRAALRQIAVARREGRWADLDKWALQVLSSDPLNEEATLARAESAAMAGSKTIALEIIDAYMEELGDRAGQIGLPAGVLRRRIAERKLEWVDRRPLEVPLVGRLNLMRRLTGLVDSSARREGRAAVLWGAPGIGKTRLAREVQSYAELVGFQVISVHARNGHTNRPLSTLLTLIPQLRKLPGAAGSDPATLALFDRILAAPTREPDDHHLPSTHYLSTAIESHRDDLMAALEDLISAVAAERRLLILLDDLHNADEASHRVLSALFVCTRSLPVMWLGTNRTRHHDVHSLTSTITPFTSIHVPPLNEPDAVVLASRLSEQFPKLLRPDDIRDVARIAGGNPLFVRELSVHRSHNGELTSLPQSLMELIEDRIQHMDAPTTRLLQAIALLGGLATPVRMRILLAAYTTDLVAIVERLESEGVVHLNATQGFDLHDCWLQVVSEQISPATRAALSLECALLLTSPESGDSTDVLWRAACLFTAAGAHSSAMRLYLCAAREMIERGLPAEATDILGRALELAASDAEKHTVLTNLARAQFCSGAIADVVTTVNAALELRTESHGESLAEHASLLSLRCESYAKLHRDHRRDLSSLTLLARDDRLSSAARQAVCLSAIGLVYTDRSSPVEDILFHASQKATLEGGESTTGCLVSLIYFAERGDAEEVRRINDRLESLEHEDLPVALRCRALRYRAAAMRFIGERGSMTELAERAFAYALKRGLVGEAMRTAESMAFAGLDAEDESFTGQWLARWKTLRIRPADTQLEQALTHVLGRLQAQRGDYERALEAYGEWSANEEVDLMERRRAVDVATLALVSAGLGRAQQSREFLNALVPIVQSSRASFQLDYVVEMCLRAYRQLGDDDGHTRLGLPYGKRRSAEFRMPLRPFSRELLNVVTRLAANQEPLH